MSSLFGNTSTVTNQPPQQVLDNYTNVTNQANTVSGFNGGQYQPYFKVNQSGSPFQGQGYSGQMVAPLNQGQLQQISNLGNVPGSSQGYFDTANQNIANAGASLGNVSNFLNAGSDAYAQGLGYAQQAAGLATPIQFSAGQVQQYMSPYTSDVVNATEAQIRNMNAQQSNQLSSGAIGSGAFGSDRAGMAQAALAGQQDIASNQTIAGLYNQDYSQALGQFNTTNQQRQAGAQIYSGLGQVANQVGAGYGQLGQTQGQMGQAYGQLAGMGAYLGQQNVATQVQGESAALQGATLQQQVQQQRDAAMQGQYQQQLQYPFQSTGWNANIAEGLGSQSGGTQSSQGSALSQVAGLGLGGIGIMGATGAFGTASAPGWGSAIAAGAAGLASDERLKEDAKPVGKTFDGQNIYSFRYKGDPTTRMGLMAQEVEKRHPESVGTMPTGFLGVDYEGATKDAAERGHFARGGGLPSVARFPSGLGGINIMARQHPLNTSPHEIHKLRPRFAQGGGNGPPLIDLSKDAPLVNFNSSPLKIGNGTMPGKDYAGIPGGNLSGMPSGAPSDSSGGLGVLDAAGASSSGVGNVPGGSGGTGSTPFQNPNGTLTPNAWLGLAAAGFGMAGGTSASGAVNAGRGALEGLKFWQGLNQNDRNYGLAQSELGVKQRTVAVEEKHENFAEKKAQTIIDALADQPGSNAGPVTTASGGTGYSAPTGYGRGAPGAPAQPAGGQSTPLAPVGAPNGSSPPPASAGAPQGVPQPAGAPQGAPSLNDLWRLQTQAQYYEGKAAKASQGGLLGIQEGAEAARTASAMAAQNRQAIREAIGPGKQLSMGPDGQVGVVAIPNYNEAESAAAGAKAGAMKSAEVSATPGTIYDQNGTPYQVSGDVMQKARENGGTFAYKGNVYGTGVGAITQAQAQEYPKWYSNTSDFERDYGQSKSTIQALANLYGSYSQSGDLGEKVKAIDAFVKSAGISEHVLPQNWRGNAALAQEAYKDAIKGAFDELRSSGASKAPATGLREMLLTQPGPDLTPEARYSLIARGYAGLNYRHDMNQYVRSTGSVDTASAEAKFQQEHPVDQYVQAAQRELAAPAGANTDTIMKSFRPSEVNSLDGLSTDDQIKAYNATKPGALYYRNGHFFTKKVQ